MSYLIRGVFASFHDPCAQVFAIEQRRCLLEGPVLRFNDEQVAEDELEQQPATIEDL